MKKRRRFIILLFCTILTTALLASDHADPMFDHKPGSNITGLFVFPVGDQVIFALNIYPGLKKNGPYHEIEKFQYNVFIDTQTPVIYNNTPDLMRYGGTVTAPASIRAVSTISLQLNKDTTIKKKEVAGLENPEGIKFYTGVRDDPFIFPKFFGTNVVTMVMSIPLAAFPRGQKDFIIWASVSKRNRIDKKIDHVGRSLRTMNPRLDFLNPLHPSKHVAAVKKRHDDPGFIDGLLAKYLSPLFALRHYDFFPDVMIFTTRRPSGFPNGRRLADDIADLSCRHGDCLLWELSYADSDALPRKNTNDKEFLTVWPFLAEPWPVNK